jgi:hypothetical protein
MNFLNMSSGTLASLLNNNIASQTSSGATSGSAVNQTA